MVVLPKEFEIRVVIYPNPDEPEHWKAHCLEMDLGGYGDSVQEALEEMLQAVEGQIKHAKTLDQVFFAAPPEVWALLGRCKPLSDELVERAVRNVFGRHGPVISQAWAPRRSMGRIKRELAFA